MRNQWLWLVLLLNVVALMMPKNAHAADIIQIGVLSHRGDEATLKAWEATAHYLTDRMSDYQFEIIPLDFEAIQTAVAEQEIDFVLVNSGMYVNLETRFRISRLATMKNRRAKGSYNIFGGVVFTRTDREDIRRLKDLKNKSFMAVDESSLGGFQMGWRELNAIGLNPYEDFSELSFEGIHDRVVLGVMEGRADAGTVRTDILERMAADGVIDLNDFFVLNMHHQPEFPYALSTELYPEWPFSKLQHTSNALAQQVAITLLQMPADHKAAIAGRYSGWTVPLDYQPVHELFRDLKLPPYSESPFTLIDVFKRYWYWLIASALLLFVMSVVTSAVMRRNKRLEVSRRFLQKQHQLILNSVADGIYGVDKEGNSTFVNKAMEDITGWSAAELIGKGQHDILHHTHADGSHHPRDECPVYQTYKDNISRYIEDDVFWCKDGSSISVEYSTTPVRDERGETVGSVVVFRDITERKKTADALRDREAQLNHVARLSTMGEMLSGIAHELNQPLTAISTNSRACIRMLESGGAASIDSCSDVLERVSFQAERAGEVIRQIRHFVSKEMPHRKPVDIAEMIDIVIELMQAEIRRSRVKVTIQLDKDLPCVMAQDIQIEQVILNLLRNAIEALQSTDRDVKRITISTLPCGNDAVEIRVSDNGPGLSQRVQEHLFEPFITTKPRGQGMGLGLSISESIVQAHESRLKVDTSDEGTSFYFCLAKAECA